MQTKLLKMANGVDKHPKPSEQPPLENPGQIPTNPNPPVKEPGIQEPPPLKPNHL